MEDGKLPLVGARAPSLTPEGHHKKILSFFILLSRVFYSDIKASNHSAFLPPASPLYPSVSSAQSIFEWQGRTTSYFTTWACMTRRACSCVCVCVCVRAISPPPFRSPNVHSFLLSPAFRKRKGREGGMGKMGTGYTHTHRHTHTQTHTYGDAQPPPSSKEACEKQRRPLYTSVHVYSSLYTSVEP